MNRYAHQLVEYYKCGCGEIFLDVEDARDHNDECGKMGSLPC